MAAEKQSRVEPPKRDAYGWLLATHGAIADLLLGDDHHDQYRSAVSDALAVVLRHLEAVREKTRDRREERKAEAWNDLGNTLREMGEESNNDG